MSVRIDHLILPVDELTASFAFYCGVLGYTRDGQQGPFEVVRVAPDFVLLLVQFSSGGGLHLAFSYSDDSFRQVLAEVKRQGLPYGDRFDQADNGLGPSPQPGACGAEEGIYLHDPSGHLIEIRRDSCDAPPVP